MKRFIDKLKRTEQNDTHQSYLFKDKLFFRKSDNLSVFNQDGHLIGYIIRTHDPIDLLHHEIAKNSIYTFQNVAGEMISSVGMKKQTGLGLKVTQYLFQDHKNSEMFCFQEQKMSLTFRVKGHINGNSFEVAEGNLQEELTCKLQDEPFAVIRYDKGSYDVQINVLQHIDSPFAAPSFLTLMYCLYRMEEKDNRLIEKVMNVWTLGK
ncbi:MAG TPA: hypothetical protein VIG73_06215 [Cerasibacillus sp.]|uniref:hypothetical protein n=1 Tax=Cerasibacillus sp. TaxID=2498711 RepID=UPI002F3E925D